MIGGVGGWIEGVSVGELKEKIRRCERMVLLTNCIVDMC